MAATPFKGTMTFRNRKTGQTQREAFTATDVANALVSYNSTTNNFVQVRGNQGEIVDIIDISLSAAGVDTTQMSLIVSGMDTGERLLDSGLVSTVNNRLPGGIPIRAGSSVQLKQLA